MKKAFIFIFGFFLITLAIYLYQASLKNNASDNHLKNSKIKVITSFYPLHFFASEIGKDKINLVNITPPGSEPHDYEPTTQQLVQINTSNLLILNGGGLETWSNKIKEQLQKSKVLIVIAGTNLATNKVNEEGKIIQDPHIWLDPALAKKEAENIEKSLRQVDPQNAAFYKKNLATLKEKLDELDIEYKNSLSNCRKKDFITSHQAFGYLALKYKLNQIAISGLLPEEEPSTKKLTEITDLVKKEKISVIFFESLANPRLSQTIAQETGAKTMILNPLEGLTPHENQLGENYLSIMKQNLVNLKIALQCNK